MVGNKDRPFIFWFFCALVVVWLGVGFSYLAYAEESTFVQGGDTSSPKDVSGPTIFLIDGSGRFKENPVRDFMYFVPVISPVLVESKTSSGNKQKGSIISYTRRSNPKSFYVSCEFTMEGQGYYKNTFDPAEVINWNIKLVGRGRVLKDILDYMKFEGEGIGRIDVYGVIVNSVEIVTRVDVNFNARGRKSPVTVGLYSIKPVDSEYKYENRYATIVARVNTLSFRRSLSNPKMDIRVASVASSEEDDDFLGVLRGAIANLFIEPIEVDQVGNDAMLDFGLALYARQPTYTFPIARNLKR